jgi:large subunit ribosomal protein L9
VEVDRRKIQIAEPIKKAGEYKIPVKLHSEVTAEIKLVVEGEQEAAEATEAKEAAAPVESAEPALEVEQEGDAEEEAGE